MVIKINLLPPYIHEKRKRNVAIGIVGVLVAAEVAGLVMATAGPRKTRDELTAKKTDVEGQLSKLQTLGTKSQGVAADESKFRPKFDFITGMVEYNDQYPDLYARTAGYTYREVMYLDLEAMNNQLKFNAYVTSPSDVSRLLLGLTRSGDITGLPQIAGVPGYTQQERLRDQEGNADIAASNFLGYDQYSMGAQGGAMPGFGAGASDTGAAPGLGGMATGPSMGSFGGGAMGGGGNGPSGGGGGAMMAGASAAGDVGGMGGMDSGAGAFAGAGGGGGGTGGGLAALNLASARRRPKGFTVTVTCALRTTIVRPTYGSSGSAQAGGGMGGGMGGMMGGMDSGAGAYAGGGSLSTTGAGMAPMGGNGP